jgi:hypothetical protein
MLLCFVVQKANEILQKAREVITSDIPANMVGAVVLPSAAFASKQKSLGLS